MLHPPSSRPLVLAAVLLAALAGAPLLGQTVEHGLTAGDGADGDNFGFAVSASGDRALVGAFGHQAAAAYSGAAYVFDFDGAAWSESAKLTASDGAENALFGYAVALDGDRALVGAFGDDAETGAAYVFEFDGAAWNETAKLTASDGAASDAFGIAVALDGDRAVVGAFGDESYSGAVYVFEFDGVAWNETAKLIPADLAAGDDLGVSVAIDGDRIVAGADGADDAGASSGAAYVFERSGATWIEAEKLVAPDGAALDFFGYSVALDGDRAVAGASLDDDLGAASGAAYVFDFDGTNWTGQKLLPGDGAAADYFGVAVAILGDLVLSGSYGDDDLGDGAGSAYEFAFAGSTWSERARRAASDGAAGDGFGTALDADGVHVIVGAPAAAGGAGTAYVFTTPVVDDHHYLFLAETAVIVDRQFSTVGDVHSNGDVTFVAGAPGLHDGQTTAVDDIVVGPLYVILGDLTAGGTVTVSPATVHIGTATSGAAVAPVALPSLAFGAGGANVTVPNNGTLSLAPGSYANVRVGSRGTLRLAHNGTSGDYYFARLELLDRAALEANVALGMVSVNVTGNVSLADRSLLRLGAGGGSVSDFEVNVLGDFDAASRTALIGRIAAPYGTVTIGQRATLEGWVCADTIDVDRQVTANAPPAAATAAVPAAPRPRPRPFTGGGRLLRSPARR